MKKLIVCIIMCFFSLIIIFANGVINRQELKKQIIQLEEKLELNTIKDIQRDLLIKTTLKNQVEEIKRENKCKKIIKHKLPGWDLTINELPKK